ncbi:MAG: histidine phosphatase family protein [Oscillospiraceae bacterium]
MKITIHRHGATAENKERRYIGRSDPPLSPEGAEEAAKWPADPAAKRVFVSPLLRCRQSAAIWFPGAEQMEVPGLVEMDFGVFEGKNFHDLAEDADYRAWVEGGCTGAPPGGESRDAFLSRTVEAFRQLVEAHPGQDMHIVAHGGTIMALLSELGHPREDYFRWQVPPCHGFRLELSSPLWENGGGFTILGPLK